MLTTTKLLTIVSIIFGALGSYYLAVGTFSVNPKTVFQICDYHPVSINAEAAKGMFTQKAQCQCGLILVLIAFLAQFFTILIPERLITIPLLRPILILTLIVVSVIIWRFCQYRIQSQIKLNCMEYLKLHIDSDSISFWNTITIQEKIDDKKLYYKGCSRSRVGHFISV